MRWIFSLVFSTLVSGCTFWLHGPWIRTDPEYLFSPIDPSSFIHVPIIGVLLCLMNDNHVDGLDYQIHHAVNALGITWCYWRNMYQGMLNNNMMFEYTTPFLSLYMLTKNKWLCIPIVITYSYYRIYLGLVGLRYVIYTDFVLIFVHMTNLFLNTYWFTKILRKCYVKLIQ